MLDYIIYLPAYLVYTYDMHKISKLMSYSKLEYKILSFKRFIEIEKQYQAFLKDAKTRTRK